MEFFSGGAGATAAARFSLSGLWPVAQVQPAPPGHAQVHPCRSDFPPQPVSSFHFLAATPPPTRIDMHSPDAFPPVYGVPLSPKTPKSIAEVEPLSPSTRATSKVVGEGSPPDASQRPDSSSRAACSQHSTTHPGVEQAPYVVDQDDLIDQHVGYFLRHHPEVHARHAIKRKQRGVYQLDARELSLEWQYAAEPGGQGSLVVVDGPLRQPFSDYMEMTEKNAEYDARSVNRSSLSMIGKEQRMSFDDHHKVYTRLEAMKVAKEQASLREQHAVYIKDGKEVPEDMLVKYKTTIQQKLGTPGQQAGQRMWSSLERSSGGRSPPPPPPPTTPDNKFSDAHGQSPAYSSSRAEGALGGHAPPPPPRRMADVYASEPLDVPIFCNLGGASLSGSRTQRSPGPLQPAPWQQAYPADSSVYYNARGV